MATSSASVDAAPRRGRRLSADRSDVILGTVLDLLHEVGYDQIRMQDVADRACVGLSTIYRRWPTKQELVRAALECKQAQEEWPVTGDARADVKAFLKDMAEKLTGNGEHDLLGFLSTVRSEPEVAQVFRETVINAMQEHLRALLESELGPEFPDLDLRATAGPAILVYQAAICGRPFDAELMAERLTQLLFAPAPEAH